MVDGKGELVAIRTALSRGDQPCPEECKGHNGFVDRCRFAALADDLPFQRRHALFYGSSAKGTL